MPHERDLDKVRELGFSAAERGWSRNRQQANSQAGLHACARRPADHHGGVREGFRLSEPHLILLANCLRCPERVTRRELLRCWVSVYMLQYLSIYEQGVGERPLEDVLADVERVPAQLAGQLPPSQRRSAEATVRRLWQIREPHSIAILRAARHAHRDVSWAHLAELIRLESIPQLRRLLDSIALAELTPAQVGREVSARLGR